MLQSTVVDMHVWCYETKIESQQLPEIEPGALDLSHSHFTTELQPIGNLATLYMYWWQTTKANPRDYTVTTTICTAQKSVRGRVESDNKYRLMCSPYDIWQGDTLIYLIIIFIVNTSLQFNKVLNCELTASSSCPVQRCQLTKGTKNKEHESDISSNYQHTHGANEHGVSWTVSLKSR